MLPPAVPCRIQFVTRSFRWHCWALTEQVYPQGPQLPPPLASPSWGSLGQHFSVQLPRQMPSSGLTLSLKVTLFLLSQKRICSLLKIKCSIPPHLIILFLILSMRVFEHLPFHWVLHIPMNKRFLIRNLSYPLILSATSFPWKNKLEKPCYPSVLFPWLVLLPSRLWPPGGLQTDWPNSLHNTNNALLSHKIYWSSRTASQGTHLKKWWVDAG